MSKLKILLLALFFSMLLFGCESKITEGTIYEKEFVSAHNVITYMPITSFYEDEISTTLMPLLNYYPDAWYIKIQSNDPDENGKYEKAEYSVSEEIFNQYKVGDYYIHKVE